MKDFVNKIERNGEKDNDSRIGWIGEAKKYPFRIILIDKNDGHKGIYFESIEKAESVRIYLSQIYKFKGNSNALFGRLSTSLK